MTNKSIPPVTIERVRLVWHEDGESRCEPGDERRAAWKRGDFSFLSCQAFATIRTGSLLNTLSSGGLYGIESDSSRPYMRQIEDEQLEELADVLGALGIDTSAAALRTQWEG